MSDEDTLQEYLGMRHQLDCVTQKAAHLEAENERLRSVVESRGGGYRMSVTTEKAARLPDEDEHILDEPLGNIHECALALAFMGLTAWALKLGRAHEEIQAYLISLDETDAKIEREAREKAGRDAVEIVECLSEHYRTRFGEAIRPMFGDEIIQRLRKHFGLEGRQNA